jgi:acetoin utilization deacetylase AcuC-like enzyme
MDIVLEILKYTLPALIVFITAYVLIRAFIQSVEQRNMREITESTQKTVLPIRLQAYERLALLLERISPESLIMRVNRPDMTAKQLHSELLSSIRAEFEHNLSQQVYISNEAWEKIRTARGNVINLVNTAANQVKEDATAITLSQKVFEQVVQLKSPPVQEALEFLKEEIRELY